ncbi:Large polyvalent protein associated domain-containing protein [Cupriavidus necator]|uniref:hypothetical protein n=1 Tax=Cupriavidus necator TaxID=106590 RepID=UPI003F73E6A6
MNPNCIKATEAAIGRQLTQAEIAGIEARLRGNLREMARTDYDSFAQMTPEQRLMSAAQRAMEQDAEVAAKKAQRSAQNLLTQTREANSLTTRGVELTIAGRRRPFHAALFERMRQVDGYVRGVQSELWSRMVDTVTAAEPRFFGLMEDPAAVRAFVQEVYGQDSGSQAAKQGAKAYLDTMEVTRQRANSAGAMLGKLDYGYLPQAHSVRDVARAGKDAWVDYVMPRVDRERYVNEDGSAMSDAEMVAFLGHAYDTISTEGRNKLVPGQTARPSRASRFDEAHRAIHFKDADSYLQYLSEFGRGSVFEQIQGHVTMMGKNIGLMESMGPNAGATYRLLKDTVEKADNAAGAREFGATLDMAWDTLNGATAQPVSQRLADFGQGIRNFTTAVKLQGVMLSSVTDVPLMLTAAKYNGMPLAQTLANTLRSFGGDTRAEAARMGLAVESISSEMQRWHGDNLAQGWSSKLANTTMRLTLVEAWTNALRRGFSLTLASRLDGMRQADWAMLKPADRRQFADFGVTEQDWRIWQMADATEYRGQTLLTAEALRNIPDERLRAAGIADPVAAVNQASAKLLGFVDNEAHTAVLGPDLMTRATLTQGTKAGTVGGELARSTTLFKSFAFAMISRHLRRLQSIETAGGKLAYSASVMTGLTLFGALAMQLKDLATGKDPRDMTTPKFWGAAFMQGGGLGIFGDVLYTGLGGDSRGGQANWTGLLGPVAGTAFDLGNVTLGNVGQAMQGKETHAGAELVRFGRQNIPFANLWYLRAAVDHAFVHDMQETLSPGYLSRMRRRQEKEWGSGFWWAPGEAAPERAPDVSTAVGGRS